MSFKLLLSQHFLMPHRKRIKDINKPFCWYCDRSFDDEKILQNHQKACHFRCPTCRKRFSDGRAVAVHFEKVHNHPLKEFILFFYTVILIVSRIPKSNPATSDPEQVINGLNGVKPEYIAAHKGITALFLTLNFLHFLFADALSHSMF